MRHSIMAITLLSMSVILGFGCENTDPDPLGQGGSDSFDALKKDKTDKDTTQQDSGTVCSFNPEKVTVDTPNSVSITSSDLKVIKEKDLAKKEHRVEIDIDGSKQSFSAKVEDQGSMKTDMVPGKEGPGTLTVFEYDRKKDKKKEIASCTFMVEPPSCRCPEGSVCEEESGECVDCNGNGDCLGEGAPACVDNTCVECADENHCSDRQVCKNNACVDVECAVDGHCQDRQICTDSVCADVECTVSSQCDSGQVCDTNSNTCLQGGEGCQVCPKGQILYRSDACDHIGNVAPEFVPGSEKCQALADMANSAGCCDPDGPPGLCDFEPPEVQYVGPYQACNLCRDGDYPYNTSMVINFLYLGAGSCAQYYEYALAGRIPDHMCDPVKYFAYEPCGCGEFNPREQQCKE